MLVIFAFHTSGVSGGSPPLNTCALSWVKISCAYAARRAASASRRAIWVGLRGEGGRLVGEVGREGPGLSGEDLVGDVEPDFEGEMDRDLEGEVARD